LDTIEKNQENEQKEIDHTKNSERVKRRTNAVLQKVFGDNTKSIEVF
jgi:hypothetical protein